MDFRIYIDLNKMQPFLPKYISIRKILYARFVLLVFPPGNPRKSRQYYNIGARKPDVNIKSVNSAGQWFFSVPATPVYINICILPLRRKSYFWTEGGLHKYGIYRVRFYATGLALIYRITAVRKIAYGKTWKYVSASLTASHRAEWIARKKCIYTAYCSIKSGKSGIMS